MSKKLRDKVDALKKKLRGLRAAFRQARLDRDSAVSAKISMSRDREAFRQLLGRADFILDKLRFGEPVDLDPGEDRFIVDLYAKACQAVARASAAQGALLRESEERRAEAEWQLDLAKQGLADSGPDEWLVVYPGVDQRPVEVWKTSDEAEARAWFDRATTKWSEAYLCRVVHGPGRGQGTVPNYPMLAANDKLQEQVNDLRRKLESAEQALWTISNLAGSARDEVCASLGRSIPKTIEELEAEYQRWLAGGLDWHDDIIAAFKQAILKKREAEGDLVAPSPASSEPSGDPPPRT